MENYHIQLPHNSQNTHITYKLEFKGKSNYNISQIRIGNLR